MGSDWDIEFDEQEIHDRQMERLRQAEAEHAAELVELVALRAEVKRLRVVLASIQEQAAEGLRRGESGSLWQIEADARTALTGPAPAPDDPRQTADIRP
jgi:hypothetical protein